MIKMRWYVEAEDDNCNYVLVGDAREIIPIFKSIYRYESAHGYWSGCGYNTWQRCPRKGDGVLALVFEGRWCEIRTDADYIASCLVDGDWEPDTSGRNFFPHYWWFEEDNPLDEVPEDDLF